jgi:capsular polysaccharide transport system permease protein
MIDPNKHSLIARASAGIIGWVKKDMTPVLLQRRILGTAAIVSLLAAVYWIVIASDRYVSEAHVIIQRTDLASGQAMDFSSLLGGAANGSLADQFLLRDHLLSVDMLKKLDAALNLRAHFSDSQRDPLSRMWFEDASMEWFHRFYLSRVSVEFDTYAGVLIIKSQGYDPKFAHAISTMLVKEGERFMNDMAKNLALEQVAFLEKQVSQMNNRVMQTRQAVLVYQNRKGLVSPQATAENISEIVSHLKAKLTELQAQRSTLQGYLVPDHPNIVQLNLQTAAIEKQIAQEEAKLASPNGQTLNRTIEEFQRLQLEAGFAQDIYKTALIALEKGRVEATRTLKKVSVLQAPTVPEYPLEPRRIYNTVVFMLVAMLLAGIAHLLAAIVRDHKD